MRAVGVVRVGPDDVGRRVSLRRRITAPAGEPGTSDAVGRLLAHDGDHLLIARRDGGRVRVRAADLLAARVVPPRPAAALELDASRGVTGLPPIRSDLQLCLNGARARGAHTALPLDGGALARNARAAAALGVGLFHAHAREAEGRESLAASAVEETVRALRTGAPGCEVSVSTGAWIEGDPDRRAALVARWEELPDLASVNLAEEGAVALAELLLHIGVGVEAGLASTTDLDLLRASGLDRRCQRILIEPPDEDPGAAVALAADLHARAPARVPHLVHGEDATAWPLLRWAAAHGVPTRIGLEDVLVDPHGDPAEGNAGLARTALAILGG